MSESRPDISIVVTNWNGAPWIARCLSSLLLSARECGRPFELIVVDDASGDGSADIVAEKFPRARLLRNTRNEGFGRATMRGARAARGRVLVLCNNDLVAQETYIRNLTRWFFQRRIEIPGASFPRRRLFGVSARTLRWWDGEPQHVCMNALWRGGRITPGWTDPDQPARCVFVQAGAAAYDRRAFLRLGGLQPLFEPGYWEDYDLSWYAAKCGYISIYDPQALALHHGGGSMTRRFGDRGVALMQARNHLLFEWVNLRDPLLLAEYCLRLPLAVARDWRRPDRGILTEALSGALSSFRSVMRLRLKRAESISDKQLLAEGRDSRSS